MRNCAKDTENERDHIILPGEGPMLGQRSHSYSDTKHGRAGLSNGKLYRDRRRSEGQTRSTAHFDCGNGIDFNVCVLYDCSRSKLWIL